jgi:hypothetical protein
MSSWNPCRARPACRSRPTCRASQTRRCAGSARGPDVTRSQLVRNLAEPAFAPLVAARLRGLVWSADGEDAFTIAAPAIDAGAIVRFLVENAGDVRSARSPDRPRDHGHAGYLNEPHRLVFDPHERVSSGSGSRPAQPGTSTGHPMFSSSRTSTVPTSRGGLLREARSKQVTAYQRTLRMTGWPLRIAFYSEPLVILAGTLDLAHCAKSIVL